MYVSIGNNRYLKQKDIVGIFDMDTATVCIATRNFLSTAQKSKKVEIVDADIPKSFVLTAKPKNKKIKCAKNCINSEITDKTEEKVYLCKLSSGVLFSRSHNAGFIGQSIEGEENGDL